MNNANSDLFISVIIPVFNDSKRLKLCLDALSHQTYPFSKYEILVIDNGSTENLDLVKHQFTNIIFAQESKQGSYCARNKGISFAKGDILAFTDSDCIPSSDWLEEGFNSLLANSDCGIVAGKIEVFFQHPTCPTLIEMYEKVSAFPQEKYVKERQFGVTANLFTFKGVIDKVGQFNDSLKSGGDREWGRRVANHGYKIVYSEKVCVRHPARRNWQLLHKKIIRQTSGMLDISALEGDQSNFTNWIAYILPSPRIIKLIIKDPEINGIKVKSQVLAIMLLVKCIRLYEFLLLFFKLKNKSYQ